MEQKVKKIGTESQKNWNKKSKKLEQKVKKIGTKSQKNWNRKSKKLEQKVKKIGTESQKKLEQKVKKIGTKSQKNWNKKSKKLELKKKLEVYLLIINDSDNCCLITNKIFSLKFEYFEYQICNYQYLQQILNIIFREEIIENGVFAFLSRLGLVY